MSDCLGRVRTSRGGAANKASYGQSILRLCCVDSPGHTHSGHYLMIGFCT